MPLVATIKKDSTKKEKDLMTHILGKECGEIMITQGKFPSSNVDVNNELPGPLWWIGWDYLYENDMIALIETTRNVILGETK